MEPIGQCHGCDLPFNFRAQNTPSVGAVKLLRQQASLGHEEGRCELLRLLLRLDSVWSSMLSMHDQMAQFVGRIEAPSLAACGGFRE